MKQRSTFLLSVCSGATLPLSFFVVSTANAQAVATAPESQQKNLSAASAAPSMPPQPEIPTGEIIVTAQKRSERMRDVPLAITAATGEQLKQLNVTSPAGLEKITPGFTSLVSGYGVPIYTIRGIGFIDNSTSGAPAVSVYVDQVPLPFSLETAGATLDIARVEVLKGPQGTLFGENSTGGAINYIAAKPTKSLAYGGDVSYGRFNAVDVNAYISGPLSDTLRVRLAVRSENRGDWQKSYTRNDSLGQRDFLTGRLLVDWVPTDRLSFELNVNGWRDKSDTIAQGFLAFQATNPTGYPEAMAALSNYPVVPRDPRAADWNPNQSFRRNDKFYQVALTGTWQISDSIKLNSISSYIQYRPYIPVDGDGTSFNDLSTIITGDVKTGVQELRLSGNEGRLKWTFGGNYEYDDSRERDMLSDDATNSGVGPYRYYDFFLDNNQKIRTAAVFGGADYRLADTLTVQGSARYTDMRRKFDGCLRDSGDGELARAFSFLASALSDQPVTIPAGSCVTFADDSPTPLPIVAKTLHETNVSYRVGLNWKPDHNTLIYISATQGYKAGGFSTLPAVRAAQLDPAKQERVRADELGVKTSALDNAVQIDASVFYYDYANKQIRGFVDTGAPFGNLPTLVNVPKSNVLGSELTLTVHPLRGITFLGGASYVRTRVNGPYLVNDQAGNVVDAGGEAFPSAPKWQLNGDVQYDWSVNTRWSAFVGGHMNYRTKTSAFLGGNPIFDIPGYALLDLRAGYQSKEGRWRIEVFGDNVTNKYYYDNVTRPIDAFSRIAGMPTTYGVRLGYRFQ